MSGRDGFCTFFNIQYLSRGLVLYESLLKHCKKPFDLVVFTFDDESERALEKFNKGSLRVFRIDRILPSAIQERLMARSTKAYFWSLTPFVVGYCLNELGYPNVTYLDADLEFYQDPALLEQNLPDWDILLSPHFYGPKSAPLEPVSGKYCVQFVGFKNTPNAKAAVKWWWDSCLEWCDDVPVDGKFGDQKYVEEFSQRFEKVEELTHQGGGLAPWNLDRYEYFRRNKELFLREIGSGKEWPLVFVHFHGLKDYAHATFRIVEEDHPPFAPILKKEVYRPYCKRLDRWNRALARLGIKISQAPFSEERGRIWKRIQVEAGMGWGRTLTHSLKIVKGHFRSYIRV